jgi:molybdenum cofactor cytidylyltransferase
MITAVVLAAGISTRMGTPKMLLPWGNTTVIGQVISTLTNAGLEDILVVVGGNSDRIAELVKGPEVHMTYNPDFGNGEMLSSVQVGLRNISGEAQAGLIVLGDQPQIKSQIVQTILDRYYHTGHHMIVPSYRMHRGHPWILGKLYWEEVLALQPPLTLHDFLNTHHDEIDYVIVESSSVMQDLDTQQDYLRDKP